MKVNQYGSFFIFHFSKRSDILRMT